MANKYGEEIYSKALLEVKAALTGHQAGQGSEFLPTETANEIINLVYDRNWARQAFQSINLRRETLKIPKLTGSITFHGRTLADADGTEASESRHTSSEITLTIKTLIANVPIGNRVVAYGVEGLLPVIRSDLATRLAFIEEACLMTGGSLLFSFSSISSSSPSSPEEDESVSFLVYMPSALYSLKDS